MSDQSIRVVIAEDDYYVNEEIKRSLREKTYTIVGEASNGEEAVQMAIDLKPDVVIMDIKMPNMEGIEAARLIQEENPVPVVVLTAQESEDLLEQASKAGVGAYLIKPPSSVELDRAITIAIARHHDLMEMQQLYNELKESQSKIKTLKSLLPICSYCKDIRNDEGYWNTVEKYIADRSEVDFSHGICPKCAKKYYPEYMSKSD